MKKSTKNMLFAFVLNFSFSVIELIGGLFTNSIAIMSDALHDFGDSISIGIALALEKKSEKKSDAVFTYGYARFSLLGALLTALILTIGSVFVIFSAASRLISPEEVKANGMLFFAIIGIVINGLAVFKTAKGDSLNEKTLNLHMLEDLLGWVAVLAGGIVIKITEWYFIDPILSLIIGIFVLIHAIAHLKEVFSVFLEKAPCDVEKVKAKCLEVEGVLDVHHVHLWSLDGNATLATLHAQIEKDSDYEEVRHKLHHKLQHLNVNHATIEIEYKKREHTECVIETHHHCHSH
ncbi:MAG: cation transporter [Clostridia bacterium]|nr:cation transporter [Clostridia bacterium]